MTALKSWFANAIIGNLNGIVELWSFVETDPERDALMLATREIRSVKKELSHFGKIAPWVCSA